MKKIAGLLLCLGLVFWCTIPAWAAAAPVLETDQNKLFIQFDNAAPGDLLAGTVVYKNPLARQMQVRLDINGSEDMNNSALGDELLGHLTLTLWQSGPESDQPLYSGPLAATGQGEFALGALDAQGADKLYMEISIPGYLGNEFQNVVARCQWVFYSIYDDGSGGGDVVVEVPANTTTATGTGVTSRVRASASAVASRSDTAASASASVSSAVASSSSASSSSTTQVDDPSTPTPPGVVQYQCCCNCWWWFILTIICCVAFFFLGYLVRWWRNERKKERDREREYRENNR